MYYIIEGVISSEEYAQAARCMMLTPKYLTSLFFAWILSILLLIFLGKYAAIINLAVYAFLVTAASFVVQWLYMPYKFKKAVKKHSKYTEPKKWILTDTHCEVISESVTIRYSWQDFSRLLYNRSVLLFVLQENKSSSVVIPLRLLGTEAKTIAADIGKKISEAAVQKKRSS